MYDQFYRSEMRDLLTERQEQEPSDAFDDLSYHFRELIRYSKIEPHSAVQDIINTAELRRRSFWANVSVLVAGLCGGIIGGMLGALLTYILTG